MARILCVDDERLVRRAVVRVLLRLGHQVMEAGDGHTAIAISESSGFDVALVDFEMVGGVDGLGVLRVLRGSQPGCMRILMTGRTDFPVVVQAINEGEVLRVLPKPFQAEELEAVLDEVLGVAKHYQAMAERQREQADAGRHFQECLDQDLLRLAVQPIFDLDGGALFAVECLLRPRHPELSNPLKLLRAAERAARINDLGEQVNRLAAAWAVRIPKEVPIFVNVHPSQFDDPDLMRRFAALLPHVPRVVLEITERSSLQDIPHWETAIAELGAAGFQFAVDDLGAGYSGLSLLAELRPSFIKVDMSIVRDVHKEPRKQRLVDLLVNFANATGTRLVAEGVENAEEAAELKRCGAHLVQGYYFARPMLEWG